MNHIFIRNLLFSLILLSSNFVNSQSILPLTVDGLAYNNSSVVINKSNTSWNASDGIRLEKDGASFIVKFDEVPGKVSFNMIQYSGTMNWLCKSTVNLVKSNDGVNWSACWSSNEPWGVFTVNLDKTTRYLKFSFDKCWSNNAFFSVKDLTISRSVLALEPTLEMNTSIGAPIVSEFTVYGSNLAGDLNLVSNNALFEISTSFIPKSMAEDPSGVKVKVTFKPFKVGTDLCSVKVTDSGYPNSYDVVDITGNVGLLPPAAQMASNVGAFGFTANWFEAPGAESYLLNVYQVIDGEKFYTLRDKTVFGTNFIVDGLNRDSKYFYTLVSVSGDVSSIESNEVQVNTSYGPKIVVSAENVDFGGISVIGKKELSINIKASELLDDVFLDLQSDRFSVSVDMISKDSFYNNPDGVDVKIIFEPNGAGVFESALTLFSGFAEDVIVSLKGKGDVEIPVILEATAVLTNGFTANWMGVNDAEGYLLSVFKNGEAGSEFVLKDFDVKNSVSYKISGLNSSTDYYYFVKAYLMEFASDESGSANVRTLDVPDYSFTPEVIDFSSIRVGSEAMTSVVFKGKNLNNDIVLSLEGNCFALSESVVSASDVMSEHGAEVFVYFNPLKIEDYFAVLSVDGASEIQISGRGVLDAPKDLSSDNIGLNNFTVSWGAVEDVTDYVLTVIEDVEQGNVMEYNVSGKTSFDVIGLKHSSVYRCNVKSVLGDVVSDASEEVNVNTLVFASVTAYEAVNVKNSGFTAGWSASVNAESYLLTVYLTGDPENVILNDIEVDNIFYDVADLSPESHYSYFVRCKNGINISDKSNIIDVTTLPITDIVVSPIELFFEESIVGKSYVSEFIMKGSGLVSDVYLDVEGEYFTLSHNHITIEDALQGVTINVTFKPDMCKEYMEFVKISSGDYFSELKLKGEGVVPMPIIASATEISYNGFTANWLKNEDIDFYLLDVYTLVDGSAVYSLRNFKVTDGFCRVDGLFSNTEYVYNVRGVINDNESVVSEGMYVLTSVKPEIVVSNEFIDFGSQIVTGQSGKRFITISAIAIEDSVLVESDNSVFKVDSDMLTMEELADGKQIGVVFTPSDIMDFSGSINLLYKESVIGTIKLTGIGALDVPEALAASLITKNSFTANWNEVAGADGYLLSVWKSGSAGKFVLKEFPVSGLSKIVDGLESDCTYYYGVKSFKGTFISGMSDMIQVRTAAESIVISDVKTLDFGNQLVFSEKTNSFNLKCKGLTSDLMLFSDDDAFVLSKSVIALSEMDFEKGIDIEVKFIPSEIKTYIGVIKSENYDFGEIRLTGSGSLSVPNVNEATQITIDGFVANWVAPEGVSNFKLLVNDVDGQVVFEQDVVGESMKIGSLNSGSIYVYKVASLVAGMVSEYSNEMVVETLSDDYNRFMLTGLWNEADKWSKGYVPGENDNVYIDAKVSLSDIDVVCNELVISANGFVTINENASLVVGNVVNNNGKDALSIIADAEGRCGNFISGSMNGVMGNLKGYLNRGSNLLSFPFETLAPNFISSDTDVRKYDEVSRSWSLYNGDFFAGNGYMLSVNGDGKMISVDGIFNGYDKEYNLNYTTADNVGIGESGWNLIGNSWTAAINTGILKDVFSFNMDRAFYLFNEKTGNYVPVVFNAPTINSIPVMKGFFVKANGNNSRIVLPYNATTTENSPSIINTGMVDSDKNFFKLFVKGAVYSDELVISENSSCSNEFDNGWDARKLMGIVDAPSMFVKLNDIDNLSIYRTDKFNDVEIGFRTGIDNEYVITSDVSNFKGPRLLLRDSQRGIYHNLLSGKPYKFIANPNQVINRFHITTTGPLEVDLIEDNCAYKIYAFNKIIYVESSCLSFDKIIVCDVSGRVLIETSMDGKLRNELSVVNDGIYIVRVISDKNIISEKVIIK